MLDATEKQFVDYWRENRLRRKKTIFRIAAGLPLAALMAIAIVANFLSGWYKRATMDINVDPSVIVVVLIAVVLIAVFIVVFSARHRWEMQEQRYRELLAKENRPD